MKSLSQLFPGLPNRSQAVSGRLNARTFSVQKNKPIFFDMQHSNNAARIRLWLALKNDMKDKVNVNMVTYADLQTPQFAEVNPLKKVPALIREDGVSVFESSVILNYLEDKYAVSKPSFTPNTPEGRQLMDLIIRCHDLYVASPNCTQPGFSHSQGAMYLAPYATKFCNAERTVTRSDRAAKLKELWKQLIWLETNMSGPYLAGDEVSLADFTWYPTTIFMEFMLPRVFGWPDIFHDPRHLPRLSSWWQNLTAIPEFREVRNDIFTFWERKWKEGQFESILPETEDESFKWKYFEDGTKKLSEHQPSQKVLLNYQQPPPVGKRTGRYINQPDCGDLSDQHIVCKTDMHNGRELNPPASLETHGFTLINKATSMPSEQSFKNDEEVAGIYYGEMMEVVKRASGASWVYIFDHTVRESGNTNLNAVKGSSAAPVPRVHCDYTIDGAPRRLEQLGEEDPGIFSRLKNRRLTKNEIAELGSGRFAFINVWRSIDDVNPVMKAPLAVCDASSVPNEDRFLYELHFPDRVGENYSLQFNPHHQWYYYPRMRSEECLVFKVYDKKECELRFVFHTSFDDPLTPVPAPRRRSIEVRAIAFFD